MSKISDEIHKRAIKKFPKRQVVSLYANEIWAMDLVDMSSLVEYNKQYKYMLTVIDVYTKYAWGEPLKDKKATSVLNALKHIVEESKRKPQRIWVDQGSEFYNKQFNDWCKQNDITIYSTFGESKSVVIERFNRTLKGLMFKQFTATNSRDWVSILSDLLNTYNNKKHGTIKMTPTEASQTDKTIEKYTVVDIPKVTKPKFKVGDHVRISKVKGKFEKGYQPNWTYEVFTVKQMKQTIPYTYILQDYDNEEIKGSFYEQEMQKTSMPDYYEVEKVIKTRKVGNKKEYLVKWYGWPVKFNSWVTEDNIHDIKN